jgi:phospholipid-binding lipoprotein MlaA
MRMYDHGNQTGRPYIERRERRDHVMNRDKQIVTANKLMAIACLLAVVLAAGCARSPGVGSTAVASDTVHTPRLLGTTDLADDSSDAEDYDPWQSFNEKMFAFNHDILDRYLVKPAAQGWSHVMPTVARQSISRLFDNLDMPRRFVNNLLQARPVGAGRELARFAVNTTVGLGGLFDVATPLHIEASNADAGQTLALYGAHAGPYLVLPTMPPSTVRDAIGKGIDGMLDPISYFLPFVANRAKSIVTAVNERSLNLELYDNVEDSVLDLYTAARNGYLQRRRRGIELAMQARREEWMWAGATPVQTQPEQTETARSPRTENPT